LLDGRLRRRRRSLKDDVAMFDEDGGSTDRPGCWSFSFGYRQAAT